MLGANQIQRLQASFGDLNGDSEHDEGASSNAIEYYTIIGKEFIYGDLVPGLVNDDNFAGIVANNYTANKIVNDSSQVYSMTEQNAVTQGLLDRDYLARFDRAENNGGVWDELTGLQISNYHDEIFVSLNFTPEAWTGYYIVRALNNTEVWRTDFLPDYGSIYAQMWGAYLSGDVNANRWLQDVRAGIVYNIETDGLELGDRVLAESAIEYLPSILSNLYARVCTRSVHCFACRNMIQVGIGSDLDDSCDEQSLLARRRGLDGDRTVVADEPARGTAGR